MRTYIRQYVPGGTYFFTLNLQNRKSNLLTKNIHHLKASYQNTQNRYPFKLNAMVILPEHLHFMMTLPKHDVNFSKRISLFKSGFSRLLPKDEVITKSRISKRERGIWQRRFWEHCIRNEDDFNNHINYILFNPVKHGYVDHPQDWPYSISQYHVGWALAQLTL